MAKFIVRRILLLLLTMFLVSAAVFLITESSLCHPGPGGLVPGPNGSG
jgi:ABC-type dipeptide/oligopeptide/nickel transport system permease component